MPTKFLNKMVKTLEDLFDLVHKNKETNLRNHTELLTKLKVRDEKVAKLEKQVESLIKDMKYIKGSLNDREQYARGWSVRVFGLHVGAEEEKKLGKDRAVMKKAYDRIIKPILKEAKAKGEIKTVPTAWYNVLENGHKLKPSKKATPGAPPPIILRFCSKYTRNVVLRNKKQHMPKLTAAESTEFGSKSMKMSEDLTTRNFILLSSLWDDARVDNAWTIDGRIRFTKVGDARINHVQSSLSTVDEILQAD